MLLCYLLALIFSFSLVFFFSGGGVWLLRTPEGSYEGVNARERAPLRANYTMFSSDPFKSQKGALSVAVPGEVAGMKMVHQKYGSLAWSSLFDRPVQLCQEGFIVDKVCLCFLKRNFLTCFFLCSLLLMPSTTLLFSALMMRWPKRTKERCSET